MAIVFLGCGSSSATAKSADGGPADGATQADGPTQADGSAPATDGGGDAFVATGPETTPAACPVVVSAAKCDKNMRPIVFVHGTYSSGTDIAHMASLFGSNGFCQDRFYAIDYDSVTASATIGMGGVGHPAEDCTAPNMPTGCGNI